MSFWLIIILIFVGFFYIFFGFLCYCNYRNYNNRTKPPTGQVPVEERCVVKKEYLNSYAK